MISFGQILFLIFLGFLLFGDLRKLFNGIIIFIVNMKTIIKKFVVSFKEKSKSSK